MSANDDSSCGEDTSAGEEGSKFTLLMTAGIPLILAQGAPMKGLRTRGGLGGLFQPGWFRVQDFAWLLFIVTLIAFTPETNYDLPDPTGAAGLVPDGGAALSRVRLEAREDCVHHSENAVLLPADRLYARHRQPVSSNFVVPVVSAATTFELAGVFVVTLIAARPIFPFCFRSYVGTRRSAVGLSGPDGAAGFLLRACSIFSF